MRLYMAVTADKYELPISVSSQIRFLARNLGICVGTVEKELSSTRTGSKRCNGQLRGYTFVEVEVDDDD